MKGQAQDIIARAHVALQDETGTRWPATELVTYLNDGQRVLVGSRPSETAVTVEFAPTVGAVQTLPEDAMLMLEVRCNTAGRRRALTPVDRKTLESVARDWQSPAPSAELVHFMHGPMEPRVFYVYPPASSAASLQLTYSRYPTPVAHPVGVTAADVVGTTDLESKWNDALLDYVLYRAWLKDAESSANASLAAGYLSTFTAAVGAQAQPKPAA